jgi:hypothetical protein
MCKNGLYKRYSHQYPNNTAICNSQVCLQLTLRHGTKSLKKCLAQQKWEVAKMQVLKESEDEERKKEDRKKEERTMTEIFWDAHKAIL